MVTSSGDRRPGTLPDSTSPISATMLIVADESGFLCAKKLGALTQDAFAAVRDEARANDKIVVDLGGAGITGADEVHMRARPNPRASQDGFARACDGADDVCTRRRFFGARDGGEREAELRLMSCGECAGFVER